MSSDYKKLLIFADVEAADSDVEKKEPKLAFKKMLKVVLIWTCLISMSMWLACFTWTFGHSITNNNVTLEKPMMDEKCFIIYFLGVEDYLETPKNFEKETPKKLEMYAIFEQFAHHQEIRNKYYLIDPIYFIGFVCIITTTIEIYHLLCCYVYKKNGFTTRFMPCFHVYYCTLFFIFFVDAFVFASQMEDEKFLQKCKYQFLNY